MIWTALFLFGLATITRYKQKESISNDFNDGSIQKIVSSKIPEKSEAEK